MISGTEAQTPTQEPETTDAEVLILKSLTKVEVEVAVLLAQGLGNKDIGRRQSRSVETIKEHVHNLLTKTKFYSRVHLAAWWNLMAVKQAYERDSQACYNCGAQQRSGPLGSLAYRVIQGQLCTLRAHCPLE